MSQQTSQQYSTIPTTSPHIELTERRLIATASNYGTTPTVPTPVDSGETMIPPKPIKFAPIHFHTGVTEGSKRDTVRKALISWGIPRCIVVPFFAWLGLTTCARPDAKPSVDKNYLVIGIFSNSRGTCRESCLRITHETFLFWQMWIHITLLRGPFGLLSLQDVKQFRVYRCVRTKRNSQSPGVFKRRHTDIIGGLQNLLNADPEQGQNKNRQLFQSEHIGVTLDPAEWHKLHLLVGAYHSWAIPNGAGPNWMDWLKDEINHGKLDPMDTPQNQAYCIEVVLGWSRFRIFVVTVLPIIASLVAALHIQNADDDIDLEKVQTAWTVGAYVVTTAALLAALLGFLTNSEKDLPESNPNSES